MARNEYWNYLEELRRSGETNMFGAAPYLQTRFGITKSKAREILMDWMQNYNPDDYEEEEEEDYTESEESEVKTYHIEAKLTLYVGCDIEAESAEEAQELFEEEIDGWVDARGGYHVDFPTGAVDDYIDSYGEFDVLSVDEVD